MGRVVLPPTTKTVADVIAEMTTIGAATEQTHGAADGVACFNHLYLGVTQAVDDALAGAVFLLPDAMHRLDVIFAQLYLDAIADLAAERTVPHCWEALFRVRDEPRIASLQFVLGGMNAHIDHDLAVALVGQWEEAGERPRRGSDAHLDFTKVNEILRSRLDAEKAELCKGLLKEIDTHAPEIDDRLAMFGIEAAREHAWIRAERLWDVRHSADVTKDLLEVLDLQVAVLGEALLKPIA
jgi:hypothetical protein